MNTSLATNGMPELSLSNMAATETVGGSSGVVATACDNLYAHAGSLDAFIDNLTAQKDEILRDWEGDAADTLREQFPGLIEAFTQIPPSIRSIADWATSTMNSYVATDSETAARISQIMGGGR